MASSSTIRIFLLMSGAGWESSRGRRRCQQAGTGVGFSDLFEGDGDFGAVVAALDQGRLELLAQEADELVAERFGAGAPGIVGSGRSCFV